MADLSDLAAAQTVKIAGADPTTGVENNFISVDTTGRQTTKIQDSSGNAVTIAQKTMANSLPVVIASDQGSLPYTRIDDVRGRVEVRKFIENSALGAGTIIHTVTVGKTFYITLAIITAVNTANATGRFTLQDGTDVTKRIPFICPQQPVGNQAGFMQAIIINEFNPLQFSTDVRAIGLSGTIAASITVHGYEE